jgi:glycosidase
MKRRLHNILIVIFFSPVRLVLDFIPNHTSKNHTWFMKSRNKEDKYGDYYVWSRCDSGGSKPTNWVC